jgi:hypothetical protein
MDNSYAGIAVRLRLEVNFDFGLSSDKDKLGNSRYFSQGELYAVNHNATPVVTTHDIHSDSHNEKAQGHEPTRLRFKGG